MNGTFEDKLLGELKQVVADRNAAPEPVRPRWRPRLVVTAGVAAALGLIAAVGIPVLRAGDASPAWAVAEGDDGWVIVTITDFRDADGLEQRLEEVGVPAEVDFVPYGHMCKEHRFQSTVNKDALRHLLHGRGGLEIHVRPAALRPDESLVIETSEGEVGREDGRSIKFSGYGESIAKGTVAPCELVPDPDPLPRKADPAQIER